MYIKYYPSILPSAKEVLEVLVNAGHESYFVGGCVRDILRNKEPHDWDICTEALPSDVIDLFRSSGFTALETGLKHGTVTVVHREHQFELTTFRIDGQYSDQRRPDSVEFAKSLTEDLKRRDFTINALAMSIDGKIIDPFGGRIDIQRRIVRCCGVPEQRFAEDALRMLRALRFATTLGFSIDEVTGQAIKENCGSLSKVSAERLQSELMKLLSGDAFHLRKVLMEYSGVITTIIPELSEAVGFQQNNPYHIFDVWEHIVSAVCSIEHGELCLRMALLLHDIGKPSCYSQDDNGVGHFYRHDEVGARIALEVLKRLRFDNESTASIVNLVASHMQHVPETKSATKRMMNRLGVQQTRRLLKCKLADALASGQTPIVFAPLIKQAEEWIDEVIRDNECFGLKNLEINGFDLIELGFERGPEIGAVLSELLETVVGGVSPNNPAELRFHAEQKLKVLNNKTKEPDNRGKKENITSPKKQKFKAQQSVWVLKSHGGVSSIGSDGYYTGDTYIFQGDKYAVADKDIQKAKKYSTKARAESACAKLSFVNYYMSVVEITLDGEEIEND